MFLQTLRLLNFRNLSGTFNFSDKVNIIFAPNGSGKTNLLEAMYMIGFGKPFRTNDERTLINKELATAQADLPAFHLTAQVLPSDRTFTYSVFSPPVGNLKKILRINDKKYSQIHYQQFFHTTIFSPASLDIIEGPARVRRNAIDDLIMSIDPEFGKVRNEYQKIVRNRNKILESMYGNNQSLEKQLIIWTQKLISVGAYIISKRLSLLTELKDEYESLAKSFFHKKIISFEPLYQSKFFPNTEFKDQKKIALLMKEYIKTNLQKEVRAGRSLYGPHRDDVVFLLNGDDMRKYSSRGEQRVGAFIFTLGGAAFLSNHLKEYPVLLLDDLFSELDKKHIANVVSHLLTLSTQIFITTSTAENIPKKFLKTGREIKLKDVT